MKKQEKKREEDAVEDIEERPMPTPYRWLLRLTEYDEVPDGEMKW